MGSYLDALESASEVLAAVEESVTSMSEDYSAFAEGLADIDVPSAAPSQSEEAPQEGGGFMDWLMPAAPESPELAPAPAGSDNPWIIERDADLKQFPSEHDVAGSSWEMVEAEGKKQIVIRKDLKSRVKRKLTDMRKGSFKAEESVGIDFGDYIGTGTVKEYIGDGVYRVVSAGQSMKIPGKYIFRGSDEIWR